MGSQPKRGKLIRKGVPWGSRKNSARKRNYDSDEQVSSLLMTPRSSPENNMGSKHEVDCWGENPNELSPSGDDSHDEEEEEGEESESERDTLIKENLRKRVGEYANEIMKLREVIQKQEGAIEDHQRRITYLMEEKRRSMQEAAATEIVVATTYEKVGKFARDRLFHHKKFVNNDEDLNEITDGGSLGKLTMDHFNITKNRRVAWWNTYKKASADGIANQRTCVSSNMKRELKGM
jgi:hypothetical protein